MLEVSPPLSPALVGDAVCERAGLFAMRRAPSSARAYVRFGRSAALCVLAARVLAMWGGVRGTAV